MSVDHAVEKVSERSQVLFAGGDTGIFFLQLVEILADVPRRDRDQLDATFFHGCQKSFDGDEVRFTGVFVSNAAEEKFVRGEDGRLAGTRDDLRQLVAEGDGKVLSSRNELAGSLGDGFMRF